MKAFFASLICLTLPLYGAFCPHQHVVVIMKHGEEEQKSLYPASLSMCTECINRDPFKKSNILLLKKSNGLLLNLLCNQLKISSINNYKVKVGKDTEGQIFIAFKSKEFNSVGQEGLSKNIKNNYIPRDEWINKE